MAAPAPAASADAFRLDDASTIAAVKQYYGEELTRTADLKTAACCVLGAPPARLRRLLAAVPAEVRDKFYGCGSPLPLGLRGARVLDLGCGSGRDCYLAAALVGPTGHVTGVDMTPQLLAVARQHAEAYTQQLGYAQSNMEFVEGRIEALGDAGIADASVDLVISNCVVNLSPDKRAVLREARRKLAEGGEFHFSDVYCDRRLSQAVRADALLVNECLGGVLYVEDFKRLAAETGFADVRVASHTPIPTGDTDSPLAAKLGEARFFSVTYRLFKLREGRLESSQEDYGHVAVYNGTIEGAEAAYSLDDSHRFEKGKPTLVSGNTAALLSDTWLAKHFDVRGDRSAHYGAPPRAGRTCARCATCVLRAQCAAKAARRFGCGDAARRDAPAGCRQC